MVLEWLLISDSNVLRLLKIYSYAFLVLYINYCTNIQNKMCFLSWISVILAFLRDFLLVFSSFFPLEEKIFFSPDVTKIFFSWVLSKKRKILLHPKSGKLNFLLLLSLWKTETRHFSQKNSIFKTFAPRKKKHKLFRIKFGQKCKLLTTNIRSYKTPWHKYN